MGGAQAPAAMPRAAERRLQRRRPPSAGPATTLSAGPLTAARARAPSPSSGPHLVLGEGHGEHGARGQRVDEPRRGAATSAQGVLEREDAGQAGRHVLAQAVAEQRLGARSPRPSSSCARAYSTAKTAGWAKSGAVELGAARRPSRRAGRGRPARGRRSPRRAAAQVAAQVRRQQVGSSGRARARKTGSVS